MSGTSIIAQIFVPLNIIYFYGQIFGLDSAAVYALSVKHHWLERSCGQLVIPRIYYGGSWSHIADDLNHL